MNCPHGRDWNACEKCRCPYDVQGCRDDDPVHMCTRCRVDMMPNVSVGAVDEALDLAWSIARCDHRRAIVLSGSDKRWCRDCGAVQNVDVKDWVEPTAWTRAKEVDAKCSYWGAAPSPTTRGPKVVN